MSEISGFSSVPESVRREILSTHCEAGFDTENFHRNERIMKEFSKNGIKSSLPRARLTGTTITGCVFKDGVVLGADTRATNEEEICDKNCEKIGYIAPNIYCCGAGTAADTKATINLVSSQLDLLRLSTGTQSRVVTACTILKQMLFRYQGHVSAALVLGGVDCTGPHLYNIYPHGSTDKLPYVTMGSGCLAAMSVFEMGYKDDMSEEEAVDLVRESILAGIFNDLGSGSNCNLTIIRKSGEVSRLTGFVKPNEVAPIRALVQRPNAVIVPLGATKVLESSVYKFLTVEEVPAPEPMTI